MLTGVALPEDRNVIKKEAEKFLKYILKKLGWMVNASAWRPVPTVQVTGRATKPVWTGAENLASPPPPGFDPRTSYTDSPNTAHHTSLASVVDIPCMHLR